MPVPAFHELFLPILTYIADGKEHTKHDVADHLARQLQLTQEDRNERLASGRDTKFLNRIGWAQSYFTKAQIAEKTARGKFRITQRGRDLLTTHPVSINVKTLQQYPEFLTFQRKKNGNAQGETPENIQLNNAQTPEEQLEAAYQTMCRDLVGMLLQQILESSPAFFEQLVIDVIVAMGYGGSRIDAGKAIGQSGDEGIDGVIKEDRLGLDLVYLQAKRWRKPVGRPHVQNFVGSLVGKAAHKGIMLTTSRFTEDAHQYVKHLPQKIVLIDGEELADLMIEFNVGVHTVSNYIVKKMDLDYFEET